MALQKCPRCTKIFFKSGAAVCEACLPEEEAEYARIREVLDRNGQLDAGGLAEAASVDLECVLRMLRDGRLETVSSGGAATCGRCGAPALSASKRLCQGCLVKLDQECAETLRVLRAKVKPVPATNDMRSELNARRGITPGKELTTPATTKPQEAQRQLAMKERLDQKRRGR